MRPLAQATPATSLAATPIAMSQATPVATPTGSTQASEPVAGSDLTPPGAFPAEPMGFYTDTTVCIGCKACEVACKNWNGLSADITSLSGDSYDNTVSLSGENWRHVKFIEQFSADRSDGRWLEQMEGVSSVVELFVLAIIATSIWSIVSMVWSGTWAVVLGIGVVLLGVVVPLFLYTRPRTFGAATIPVAAALGLLGSFLLRTVVILSSEAVSWPG